MKNILSVLIFTILFYCANAQDTYQVEEVIQVNSLQFQNLIEQENGTFLDVRTKSEFNAEHIENSGQLNYYALDFKKKLLLLPHDQPIYLYCNTGYRSQKAAEYLIKKGYNNVYNLEHGIMEWNVQELPVVEGDKSQLDKENMMNVDDYEELISSESLVFIDFYAPWCAPCRKMMPLIDSLKTEYHGKIKIEKVNSDVSKKLVKDLKLIGVPYFVLYKNNELLYEKSGMVSREELKEVFNKYLQEENKKEDLEDDSKTPETEIDSIMKKNDNRFKTPLEKGETAPNFKVTDHTGKDLELYEMLKEGPVVMIFYRGQWCPVCNKHLANLQEGLEEVKAKGAQIIAVTPEKQENIDKTIVKTNITFPVIYDVDYVIMKAYQVDFIPQKKTTMVYNTFLNADLKNAQSDDSQTLPVPATYIIGTDRKIKYVHFDPDYKNRASINEILENL